MIALEEYIDPTLLILSADHVIKDLTKFVSKIYDGLKYDQGRLVTFGIIPDYPETGYGYIEAEKSLDAEKSYGRKYNSIY